MLPRTLARFAMTLTAYLAGPDVFLPNAVSHAAKKVEICRRFGLRGLPPLNEDIKTSVKTSNKASNAWLSIYEKDVLMMERCDIIIANLTPFGGASADAGTLIEVGWFLGKEKPIFGYSNTSDNFESRMSKQLDDRFHKTDHNSTFVESDQARISQGHLTTSVPANIRFEPRKRPTRHARFRFWNRRFPSPGQSDDCRSGP
jgi:nucleoside 2-deoxyribosyltransferase